MHDVDIWQLYQWTTSTGCDQLITFSGTLQGLYDITFSPCDLLTPAFYPFGPHMESHMRYSQHTPCSLPSSLLRAQSLTFNTELQN